MLTDAGRNKMTLPTPLVFRGAPGSPYTQKMLALLRYRQIPYRILQGFPDRPDLPKPKVQLIPTFYLPDERGELEAVVDSTPLIRRFEEAFAPRSVIPSEPAIAFIDYLLEDYADEWLTKPMFHYRWYYEADVEQAGDILPRFRGMIAPEEQMRTLGEFIKERQIARLYVVGSNDTTAPVIEESYRRFLAGFQAHLEQHPFLMGRRPGASDFAVYGQLFQMTMIDPTPRAVTLRESPRVFGWVTIVNDLTGLDVSEDDWLESDAFPETLRALLCEVGRTYVPQMLANAKAIDGGADTVETTIEGKPWVQQPFPYQAKCLQWVRQEYVRLDEADRRVVDRLLDGTGCEQLF